MSYYQNGLLRPTVACLPFLAATVAFEYFLPARNLLMFFLQIVLSLPLVPLSALFVCTSRVERKSVLAIARRFAMGAG
jgi:hypothetical protein